MNLTFAPSGRSDSAQIDDGIQRGECSILDVDAGELRNQDRSADSASLSLSHRAEIRQRDEDAWDVIGRRMATPRTPEHLAQFWKRIKAANPHINFDEL